MASIEGGHKLLIGKDFGMCISATENPCLRCFPLLLQVPY